MIYLDDQGRRAAPVTGGLRKRLELANRCRVFNGHRRKERPKAVRYPNGGRKTIEGAIRVGKEHLLPGCAHRMPLIIGNDKKNPAYA